MRNLSILIIVLASTLALGQKNYFEKTTDCVLTKDLKDIAGHFTQFKKFTNTSAKEVCRTSIDEKMFDIARSLLALQRLVQPSPILPDANDDFTRSPVTEKSWWSYFKKRATTFVTHGVSCARSENIVAYVQPSYLRDVINFCPLFYKMSIPSQIGTLLHEVRHFEGYGHVTCLQGNEINESGACDTDIKDGGSYAVSVQGHVTMSRIKQVSKSQRLLSEAQAVYKVLNKFNRLPRVKSKSYIYMADTKGKVWRKAEGSKLKPEFVAKMGGPAKVYSNGSKFTLYPTNVNIPAMRYSSNFKAKFVQVGKFAEIYNEDTPALRSDYQAVNYFGQGAIVKNNELFSFCQNKFSSLVFTAETIKSLVTVHNSKNQKELFIQGNSGKLYSFTCDKFLGLQTKLSNKTFPKDVQMGVSTNNSNYFLTDDGAVMTFNARSLARKPFLKSTNLKFLSITPLKEYTFFSK